MNTGRKILSETPDDVRGNVSREASELVQTTVPLTWNKPELMLPEAQNEQEERNGFTSVLIAQSGIAGGGYYHRTKKYFAFDNGDEVKYFDFWAYMPKHPNK
jgi:hypothetical protein